MNRQCLNPLCSTRNGATAVADVGIDDQEIVIVGTIPLCKKCAKNPPLSVTAYLRLSASYNPQVLKEVQQEIAQLEAELARCQENGVLESLF